MSARRRYEIPIESSWRFVDGENDSFDTTLMPAFSDDGNMTPMSSGQPSSGYPTQQSFSMSQGRMSFNSQDSIRDFANHQDDEQVILREPFRPTVPSSVASTMTRPSMYQVPELQLRMPRIDIGSDPPASDTSSPETTRSWKWTQNSEDDGRNHYDSEESQLATRKPTVIRRRSSGNQEPYRYHQNDDKPAQRSSSFKDRLPGTEPWSPKYALKRALSAAHFFLNYLLIPVAIPLAVYFLYHNGLFSVQDLYFKAPRIDISSVCDIPALSQLAVPFCASPEAEAASGSAMCSVDFQDLMDVQAKFGDVLKKSRRGLALPLDLKRSEIATRNLRSLLRESDDPARRAIIPELNNYIDRAARAGSDIQMFYVHVGSTVDSVVNINRWTLRHVSSLSADPVRRKSPGLISRLFGPFGPPQEAHTDRVLVDKYAEHIVLIQDRLERVIEEGTALAMLLSQSQAYLGTIIQEQSKTADAPPRSKTGTLLSGLVSYLTGSAADQRDLQDSIASLRRVDAQYAASTAHLASLVEELKDILAGLADLLRRSGEPATIWADEDVGGGGGQGTLGAQVEVIRRGIQRLELDRISP